MSSSSRRRRLRRLPNLRDASCRKNRPETNSSMRTSSAARSNKNKLTLRRLLLSNVFKKKWMLNVVFNKKRESRRKSISKRC